MRSALRSIGSIRRSLVGLTDEYAHDFEVVVHVGAVSVMNQSAFSSIFQLHFNPSFAFKGNDILLIL